MYDGDRALRILSRPGRASVTFTTNQGRPGSVLIGTLAAGSRGITYGYKAAGTIGGGNLDYIQGPGSVTGTDGSGVTSVDSAAPRLTYSYNGSLPTAEEYAGPFSGMVTLDYDAYLNVTAQRITTSTATTPVTVSYGRDADGVVTSGGYGFGSLVACAAWCE